MSEPNHGRQQCAEKMQSRLDEYCGSGDMVADNRQTDMLITILRSFIYATTNDDDDDTATRQLTAQQQQQAVNCCQMA